MCNLPAGSGAVIDRVEVKALRSQCYEGGEVTWQLTSSGHSRTLPPGNFITLISWQHFERWGLLHRSSQLVECNVIIYNVNLLRVQVRQQHATLLVVWHSHCRQSWEGVATGNTHSSSDNRWLTARAGQWTFASICSSSPRDEIVASCTQIIGIVKKLLVCSSCYTRHIIMCFLIFCIRWLVCVHVEYSSYTGLVLDWFMCKIFEFSIFVRQLIAYISDSFYM